MERELLPISLVAHTAFCPRRAWLEAMGEQGDSAALLTGELAHRASDDVAASRSRSFRAVELEAPELGVCGRCDTIEEDDAGLFVVEHKATPVRRKTDVTGAMRAQLALQVGALREMGHTVVGQAIAFTSHRTREPVELTPDDHARARELVAETRAIVEADQTPPPLEDDPRCLRCSHAGVCLPDERQDQPHQARITPSDPDGQIVHLATPGARASLRAGRMRVSRRDEPLDSLPLERVRGLVVHGNVDLSGALIRELLWRGQAIVWCSGRGRLIGWAASAKSPNGGPRHRQHLASAAGLLPIACAMIAAKIANQATLLRRHGDAEGAVAHLRRLQCRAAQAGALEALLGIEGDAASRYFAAFDTMLKGTAAETLSLAKRSRRPATDPINAALNYAYGLLIADTLRAVVACGLDPHVGFIHSAGRNKPALALDLAEDCARPWPTPRSSARSTTASSPLATSRTCLAGSVSATAVGKR